MPTVTKSSQRWYCSHVRFPMSAPSAHDGRLHAVRSTGGSPPNSSHVLTGSRGALVPVGRVFGLGRPKVWGGGGIGGDALGANHAHTDRWVLIDTSWHRGPHILHRSTQLITSERDGIGLNAVGSMRKLCPRERTISPALVPSSSVPGAEMEDANTDGNSPVVACLHGRREPLHAIISVSGVMRPPSVRSAAGGSRCIMSRDKGSTAAKDSIDSRRQSPCRTLRTRAPSACS